MLYRLIYCSTANEPMTDVELRRIRDESIENNSRDGITGLLAFSNGYFLQILEGGAKAINAAFVRIEKDARHENVFLLFYSPIITRAFDSFDMAVVTETEETRKIFFKYSIGAEFNPYEFDPTAAELLLGELFEASR